MQQFHLLIDGRHMGTVTFPEGENPLPAILNWIADDITVVVA